MSIEKAKLNIQTVLDSMDFIEKEESSNLTMGQGERRLLQTALKNIESFEALGKAIEYTVLENKGKISTG